MKIYRVGGAVRDQLLGYPSTENDWVVVGATPAQLEALGYTPVGKDFPVFLHPQTREEYALARTERKSGHGYGGFTFYCGKEVTLEEDLQRRDLTINAMAEDADGEIIDPYGGQRDLQLRILRHVSPAFAEDPLRVLRVARFAARYHHLGFTLAEETQTLMGQIVAAGEMEHLVRERVWKETERALGEQSPQIFIQVLRECGALARLMPELDQLFGIPQKMLNAESHLDLELDAGAHSLQSLQRACLLSGATEVRFATLLHGLGSEQIPRDQPSPSALPVMETKASSAIQRLCERIAAPRPYRELALLVAELHLHCYQALELAPAALLGLLKRVDAFRRPERWEYFLLSCQASTCGGPDRETEDYPPGIYLREALRDCQTIDLKEIAAAGFSGMAFGEELDKRRINCLTQLRARSLGKSRNSQF